MTTNESLKPWQRQPGESRKAYHAFCHYRDQQPWERSVNKGYTGHKINCQKKTDTPLTLAASPEWRAWSLKFNWEARADSHDAALQEGERLRKAREIEAMNARQAALGVALQNLAVSRLQEIAEKKLVLQMTPIQLSAISDKASIIERRARGQATEITKREGDEVDGGTPLDLNKLTDEELLLFEKLTQKARPG